MSNPDPAWAETVRRKYRGGESTMFVLHGNVFDHVLHDDGFLPLIDYVQQVLVAETKSQVISVDPSLGIDSSNKAAGTAVTPESLALILSLIHI